MVTLTTDLDQSNLSTNMVTTTYGPFFGMYLDSNTLLKYVPR